MWLFCVFKVSSYFTINYVYGLYGPSKIEFFEFSRNLLIRFSEMLANDMLQKLF